MCRVIEAAYPEPEDHGILYLAAIIGAAAALAVGGRWRSSTMS